MKTNFKYFTISTAWKQPICLKDTEGFFNALVLVLYSPLVENKSLHYTCVSFQYAQWWFFDTFISLLFGIRSIFFLVTLLSDDRILSDIPMSKFKQMCTYIKHSHLYIDIIQKKMYAKMFFIHSIEVYKMYEIYLINKYGVC